MTAALKANGKTAEYNLDFRSGTTGIFQKSQKFCPSIQQFCPLKIEQKQRFPKNSKACNHCNYRLCWRRRWDSNPRALADNRISSAARYDHFDTSPYELRWPNLNYWFSEHELVYIKIAPDARGKLLTYASWFYLPDCAGRPPRQRNCSATESIPARKILSLPVHYRHFAKKTKHL